MKLNYSPKFFDPEKASRWYAPDIAGAMREGIELALTYDLLPARELIKRKMGHLLAMTDLQSDFRDKGRLPVKGTDAAVLRTCTRLMRGTVNDHFAGLLPSLDEHFMSHISFDCNWCYVGGGGERLNLSDHGKAAILTLKDEEKRVFEAHAFDANGKPYSLGCVVSIGDMKDSVLYWKHLQATGQGPIWVFVPHCVIGTDGVNLHPFLAECIAFFYGARQADPIIINKGHLSDTDWFGPLEPCRPDSERAPGMSQSWAIKLMFEFKTVEFAGVAEDFCDYYMKRQMLDRVGGEGVGMGGRLTFLEDCTAPIIPGAAHVLELKARAKKLGVKFINHDASFE